MGKRKEIETLRTQLDELTGATEYMVSRWDDMVTPSNSDELWEPIRKATAQTRHTLQEIQVKNPFIFRVRKAILAGAASASALVYGAWPKGPGESDFIIGGITALELGQSVSAFVVAFLGVYWVKNAPKYSADTLADQATEQS